MNETVIKLLVKNVKAFKKVLKNKDRKKRAKYKVYQKQINILYKLLDSRGRNYIVKGEL